MQLLRNAEYLGYGTARFTRAGFVQSGIKLSDLEHLDLRGRSFMITGANSGIGYATSLYLASRGGTVHMVCRSDERAKVASRSIIEMTSNPNVFVYICDLSEREDIERLASTIINQNIRLDVLVNNAASMNHIKQLNSDGIETTFATNLLSNFLLTTLLIPVLTNSPDPRVIFVSSGGALTQKLKVDPYFDHDSDPWDGITAYAMTKRQQIALCEKFADVYKHTFIKFFSMHPGWVDTPHIQVGMPEFYKIYHNVLRTPQQGADTLCWLCVAAGLDLYSGEFFRDRELEYKHLPLSRTHYKETEVNNLWNTCVKLRTIPHVGVHESNSKEIRG
jgi:dehydrogenase/reductase SDR family protein 12